MLIDTDMRRTHSHALQKSAELKCGRCFTCRRHECGVLATTAQVSQAFLQRCVCLPANLRHQDHLRDEEREAQIDCHGADACAVHQRLAESGCQEAVRQERHICAAKNLQIRGRG